ncbi:similar to Saccharomyces cerevisiae YGR109C CLB6 B-type cyclin involved in DNA replication during S phase [Maudiozyma saulgeensis]|uniref:Similar to Saccharomyces cerevisiae YGR109C CLB6 B-type cyclin involved in DNA replication during S phase n=1 Tax=Maudiozyma saulgeensis TaxID=1789683 RepID=A0A1X7QYA7_9SACH|nr:similar to Saccharomyces cerevisiae YGR109C CLB6 B-type cyclin involved in DNA replication during S phase [Kazachstania saulgeensis]
MNNNEETSQLPPKMGLSQVEFIPIGKQLKPLKHSSSRGALVEVNANAKRINKIKKDNDFTIPITQSISRVRKDLEDSDQSILKKRKIYNDEDEDDDENMINIDQNVKIIQKESPWLRLDEQDKNDPSMVYEYSNDIFDYFYKRESELSPSRNYTVRDGTAPLVRPSVRAILIDWLVEVHEKFQCFPETLYLAINIMDRFLADNKVNTDKLQLLAVTSLFIAAKFEEIHLPKLAEYAYITDGAATKDDIKTAELYMLTRLKFELAWPTPMNFLRRLSKADGYDTETRNMAKFLLEYAFCCSRFIGQSPSYLSAIAFFIARRIKSKDKKWDDSFIHYSGGIDPLKNENFRSDCQILMKELDDPCTRLPSLKMKYNEHDPNGIHDTVLQFCAKESNYDFSTLFAL